MAMTENQFMEWLAKIDRTPECVAAIERVRNNQPARRVEGRRSNVSGSFPSKKMGCTIQFESHTVEYCFIRQCELSADIVEYYDQPPGQIKLTWTDNKGRNRGTMSTADLFILHRDGRAGWVEIKPEQILLEIASRTDRYVRNEDGSWSCPSGEEFAQKSGLSYEVWSSAEINQAFQRNFEYLYDYHLDSKSIIDTDKKNLITGLVAAKQGIHLASLFKHESFFSRDDVFLLIARNELYVDLNKHQLRNHEKVPVYTNQTFCDADISTSIPTVSQPDSQSCLLVEEGQLVRFDGQEYEIFNIGDEFIWLRNNQEKVQKFSPRVFEKIFRDGALISAGRQLANTDDMLGILKTKSELDLKKALKRQEQLIPYLDKTDRQTPSTIRRWLKKYRIEEKASGCGFIALFDDVKKRGNRLSKIPDRVRELIDIVIVEVYQTKAAPTLISAYAEYETKCKNENLEPASLRTFSVANAKSDKVNETRRRKGQRAAYQIEILYFYLEYDTPRHGDRPFEVVHIDHTELEIEIYDPKKNESFGRPWLTLMIDANSRRLLAYYLTFEPPSYRSVMMVLRECVRRFGRLPQALVVDNGKEFHSLYFAALAAFYKFTIKYRPPKQPRFGSVMERIFGTTNTQFIHTLLGNTKYMKNPRNISTSHLPANNAVWTYDAFQPHLERYLYEVYDQIKHPAIFESPRSAFECGLREHGLRSVSLIAYNEVFMMKTRPTVPKGTAKVDPTKGVKINNIYYMCDDFRSPLIAGTQVEVRYEPFNIGIAFAYVNGEWKRCLSEYFAELNGLTEYEAKHISTIIRALNKKMNEKTQITAKVYRDFLEDVRSTELTLIMQRRDAEGRSYEYTDTTSSTSPYELAQEVVKPTLEVDIAAIEIFPDL